jgi:hypothetical protein
MARRLTLAMLLAVLGTLAGSISGALAAPTLSIESPEQGVTTNEKQPLIAGHTSDSVDGVTVNLFEGTTQIGTEVVQPEFGSWSAQFSSELPDGAYSAVAEQTELLTEESSSARSEFTVFTQRPSVTIDAVPTPTNDPTPSFSGSASETTGVTVSVYKGGSATGSVVAEAHASGTGGSWASDSASPTLPDGTYTAVAEQESAFGNGPGFSKARTFTVHTATPAVTLNQPSSPTNDSTPSFSGTASEKTTVTVSIVQEGSVVAEAHATGTGGGWTSGGASPALPDGTYTAVAEQESAFGNGPGFSQERTFTIDTAPPSVTLNAISTPTNDSTPSFTGAASDTTGVTVDIFKGGSASGSSVSTAHAGGTGGSWSSGGASPALSDGGYTAIAKQDSSVGNGEGVSGEIHFTVDTAAPTVTLEGIASPTNDTTPSFSGFAADTTTVTVKVYKGTSVTGSPVATASAGGTGGGWSSGGVSPALGDGGYTAIAVQESSLGNGVGSSEAIHFTVQTAAPNVTLNGVKSPSGDSTPGFSGSASDTTSISIMIYAGATASGGVVSSAAATGTGGAWSSGQAGPPLPSGQYTAVAVQESSLLGNPSGVSNEVTFVVDTSSPTVTLNSVSSPSNDTTPSFSGTASDSTPVVVHVFNGASQEVATATGSPSGGGWKAGTVSKTLGSGSYTALATESSSLGNPGGTSNSVAFTINTESPQVRLNQPATLSSNTTPTFSGTATDTTGVTVEIKGISSGATPTASASGTGTGGPWTSSAASPALATGRYTARAVQASSLGNPAGFSESRVFEVNTQAPNVTIKPVKTPSNQRSPTFTGTASESSPVVVHVLEGGHEIAKLTGSREGEAWSAGPPTPALVEGRHAYKVYASQQSTIGNEEGRSEEVPFVVDTTSPVVTLEPVKTPSNVTAPKFHGTATDTTGVTVDIYAGAVPSGPIVSTAAAAASGQWTSAAATPALASGEYTAVAVQASSLGNPAGASKPVNFVVDTTSPAVAIEPIRTPWNVRSPTFSGTTTDTKPVVVHVLDAGHEVASAEATPAGGRWKAGPVKPELAEGETAYTAYASEASSLGNPDGESKEISFVVDTNPPDLTMGPVAGSSNNFSPVFSGATTEAGQIVVSVYRGHAPGGSLVRTAEAKAVEGPAGTWTWSTSPIAPLEAHAAVYTAVARQKSALTGNPEGKSQAQTFNVDPGLPTLLMSSPPREIGTSAPTFSGTSDQSGPVTVKLFARKPGPTGCEAQGSALSQAAASHGGPWSTAPASPGLPDGEYAAIAFQSAAFEAVEASTAPACFAIDTVPPVVAVTSPAAGAVLSGGGVSVSGTAGVSAQDQRQVTVQVFAGNTVAAGSTPVQRVIVLSSAGRWSATFGGLAGGSYSVRALQSDEAGNVGVSSAVTFTEASGATAPAHGPAAAFSFYPGRPHVGETVSLVSSSTDDLSPISAYSWNLRGSTFAPGAQTQTISFASPGNHTVQLAVTDAGGRRSVAVQVVPVSYPLMRPFPVVRIAGTRSRGRVRLKVLSVQAPVGAIVSVTCSGKGCPTKSQARVVLAPKSKTSAVPVLAFPRFERSLPPGVALVVRVTHAGEMGKYTRFVVRRGKLPVRSDACLNSTEATSVPCTS